MKTHLVSILFCLLPLLPQLSAEAQPAALRERIQARLEESPAAEAIRREVLSGIAFYPDEVIEAILGVAQDPEALFTDQPSSNPTYQEGLALLSSMPLILSDLKSHPLATALLGRIAAKDPEGVWETIDQIRAEYRKRVGMAVSEAVVAPHAAANVVFTPTETVSNSGTSAPAPPPVSSVVIAPDVTVVENATPTGGVVYAAPSGVAQVGVTYVEPGAATAQGGAAYGTVQGQNASAAGYGVAVAGENAAHVGAGGVVATEDGQVHAGSAGGTVVQTPNGAVATAHSGQTHVDTQNQTFNSSHTAGAVNSQGQGVVVHQEGSGSYDSDSFQRSGQGTVQAANGQGAEWSHSGSGQKTETSASHQSSTHVETKSGQSADIEHSASVEKTDTGVDVEHGGSATTGSGQTYEWGNREDSAAAKSSSPQDVSSRSQPLSRGHSPHNQGFQQAAGGNPLAAMQQDAWKAINRGTQEMQRSLKGAQTQFARSAGKMKSAEAFSAKGMSPKDLSTALDRGMKQQKKSFGSAESKLAKGGHGMQAPPMGARGGGMMPPTPRGGGGARGGGGGGRRGR
ncbi:MAG: hypothetical protein GHCLOJNM_01860 [bacterium]|nr:hypothetical protein [bacterium]